MYNMLMLTVPQAPYKPSLNALQARYDGPIPASKRRAALNPHLSCFQQPDRMLPANFWRREARALLAELKDLKTARGGVSEQNSMQWEDTMQTFKVAWLAYRSVYARVRRNRGGSKVFVSRG